ncbi:MAG: hypothetical protein ACLFVP_08800 [Candidatus Bathyarchaeia archaeon]
MSTQKKDDRAATEITRNHLLRALDEPAVLARLVTDCINPLEVEEYLSEHILPYLRESKMRIKEGE